MAFFDFIIANRIFNSKREATKKRWLSLSFLINVGALVYFKYTYFFINLINDINSSHISLSFKILQPIGISYFVFKSLSYVIDINREVIEVPEKNPFNYLLYVSFFPNILAGPITKARDLLPQLKSTQIITSSELRLAIYFISVGLVKKILVADFISANISDRVFESPQFFSSFDLLMSCYAGLLHLYFDFSGYTDIVVGISLLLGIKISGNFNQPFKARNISEFWNRWHISLYLWLNDYVYQPIAFSLRRYKLKGAIIAIFTTFLISGFWHGANLTFVIWGLIQGIAIVIELLTQKIRRSIDSKFRFFYNVLSVFITFNFIAFLSVLINSTDINFAFEYYRRIFTEMNFGAWHSWLSIYYLPFSVMITALILQYLPLIIYDKTYWLFSKLPILLVSLFFCCLIIFLYQIASKEALPFVYIDF